MNLPVSHTRLFDTQPEAKDRNQDQIAQAKLGEIAYKAIGALYRLRVVRESNALRPLYTKEDRLEPIETVRVTREDYERLKKMIEILDQYFEEE